MDEQFLLGIILIALSMGMVFFALIKKPFSCFIDYFVAFAGVLLIAIASTNMYKIKKVESFAQNNVSSSYSAIVQNYQPNQNGSNFLDFMQNKDEDISSISKFLTLYYSSFSQTSYPNASRRWYNISPFFTSPQSICPDVSIEDTNMFFLNVPSHSIDHGFSLGVNQITGPKCHKLGLSANDSFTIFFTLKFNNLEITSDKIEILKMYANTQNNNGLSIYIDNTNIVTNNEITKVEFNIEFGLLKQKLKFTSVNKNYVYTFIILKQNNALSVNIFSNIGEISTTFASMIQEDPISLSLNSDVLLSNKELVINTNKNLQANIFNFGIYNKSLDSAMLNTLFQHIQTEIQKNNKLLQDIASIYYGLNKQIALQKQCPYSTEVCQSCSAIKDWSNMSTILATASKECLNSISKYCKDNPKSQLCDCWNPDNLMSSTLQCKNYRNIFSGKECLSVDNIDSKTLETIKIKYGLCPCSDCNKQSSITIQPKKLPPPPKIIDNVYTQNADDIDLYNALGLKNPIVGQNPPSSIMNFWK